MKQDWNGRALPGNVAVGDSFSTLGPSKGIATISTYTHAKELAPH